MMVQRKALHILIATAFVFVNLVCPCASVSASPETQGQQHQHHEAPADSDCPHKQCPDCNSALAVSCEQGALVSHSPHLTKVDLDDDDNQLDAIVTSQPARPPSYSSTGPPYPHLVFVAESPVRRHDLQLE